MCINPITVRNKRMDFDPRYHRHFIQVPCGKCVQCCQLEQNGMATRLSFECKRTMDINGHILFLTFTYNSEMVPYLLYKGQKQMCFNRLDMLYLIRALRRKYAKKGLSFKYAIFAEYGHDTKRPHYHGLFFIPKEIGHYEFCEAARKFWTDGELGNFGYMFPEPWKCKYEDKHLVRSNAGCAVYASKYACKDLSFYELPIIQEIKDLGLMHYRDCMPRRFVSHGLGDNALSLINPDTKTLVNPLNGKSATIPLYYINKLVYNMVQDGRVNSNGIKMYSRQLTEFGKVYMLKKLENAIYNRAKLYDAKKPYNVPFTGLQMAIFHYVYDGRQENLYKYVKQPRILLDCIDLWNVPTALKIYEQIELERHNYTHLFRRAKVKQPSLRDLNPVSLLQLCCPVKPGFPSGKYARLLQKQRLEVIPADDWAKHHVAAYRVFDVDLFPYSLAECTHDLDQQILEEMAEDAQAKWKLQRDAIAIRHMQYGHP